MTDVRKPESLEPACRICGFRNGDKVKMRSGFVNINTGKHLGWVHGVVEPWLYECKHLVVWRETGAATPALLDGILMDVAVPETPDEKKS